MLGFRCSPWNNVLVGSVRTGCRWTPRWGRGHARPENGTIERAVGRPTRAVARTGRISARPSARDPEQPINRYSGPVGRNRMPTDTPMARRARSTGERDDRPCRGSTGPCGGQDGLHTAPILARLYDRDPERPIRLYSGWIGRSGMPMDTPMGAGAC